MATLPKGLTLAHATGADLAIERRWLRRHWLVRIAVLLVLSAGVGYLWVRWADDWHSVAVSVGLAVVSGLLLFADYIALTRVVNRTRVGASRGELVVRHGPLPAFVPSRRLPVAEVVQLFAAKTEYDSYEVRALLRDGSIHVLVELLTTLEQARFVEERLEEALGITDRPVDQSPPPAPPEELAARDVAPGPKLGLVLLLGVLVVGSVVSGFVVHYGVVRGEELGVMSVGDDAAQMSINVSAERPTVVFWDEVDMTVPTALDDRYVDRMPRLFDYAITVEQAGRVATLRCDAFDSHVFDWSSRVLGWDHADHSWKGRLEACSVGLSPGPATVRAQRVWRRDATGVTLRKTLLFPTAYP